MVVIAENCVDLYFRLDDVSGWDTERVREGHCPAVTSSSTLPPVAQLSRS